MNNIPTSTLLAASIIMVVMLVLLVHPRRGGAHIGFWIGLARMLRRIEQKDFRLSDRPGGPPRGKDAHESGSAQNNRGAGARGYAAPEEEYAI